MRGDSTGDEGCEALFLTGAPGAMRSVYETFGSLVYTYCRRRLAPDLVDDTVQEVFVAAWRNRERFDPERGRLAAWLVGIAKYKVVDAMRAASAPTPTPGPTFDLTGDAARDESDAIANRLLARHALARLPDRTRQVIELAYIDDLSHAEIAQRYGLPIGTVKSDIRRGLERLRDYLGTSDAIPA